MIRPALALVALLFAPALASSAPEEWTRPFTPFRIIGNVYWVGTWDLSTYLITTPAGNILINTGLKSTVPDIKAGVEKLGFKLSDTKILTATHAHYDHVAGIAELKRMTGAQVVIAEPDAALLADGGKSDFAFGGSASTLFDPVKADRTLKDGDAISLGGTVIMAHLNPGHTKGATTFTLEVSEGGKTYHVAVANMGSINPGVKVSGMATYPNIREDYAKTFRLQKAMQVDVFLASHASQFHLHEKYKPGDAYDPNRFVDPKGFHAAVDELEHEYLEHLAAEAKGKK